MIQIDIKKPSMCRLTDEEGRIHKCPFLNGEYECILQGCISYWTWERQYKNCPLHEVTDTDTISRQAAIDEIKNADVVVLYYDGEPIDEAIERAIKAVKRSVVASVKHLPSAQPEIIRCKECKHQVKEWRTDKRRKDNGYMVCGCEVVGDACGYWALLGQDDDFCSKAERRTDG